MSGWERGGHSERGNATPEAWGVALVAKSLGRSGNSAGERRPTAVLTRANSPLLSKGVKSALMSEWTLYFLPAPTPSNLMTRVWLPAKLP